MNETHISAIVQIFDRLFALPNLVLGSILTATFTTLLSILSWVYGIDTVDLFGVTLPFIASCFVLMIVDWFLGTMKSIRIKKEKLNADKIVYTIMKFLVFFGWLYFMNAFRNEVETYGYMKDTVILVNLFVIFLILLREFRSIGNHIESIWGTKFYLFVLLDDIFEIIEKGFKKKLKDKFELNEEKEEDEQLH